MWWSLQERSKNDERTEIYILGVPLRALFCTVFLCFDANRDVSQRMLRRHSRKRAIHIADAFGLVCMGAGFLSCPLLCKVCKADESRKTAPLAISAMCFAVAAFLDADRLILFQISSIAALLLFGLIVSCMYYNMAVYFAQGGENNNGFKFHQA